MSSKLKHPIIHKKIIYCIVPGFLANYETGLLHKIKNLLEQKERNFHLVKFYGHAPSQKKLWNPFEMTEHLTAELQWLQVNNPSARIIILAHSQGSAITAMAHAAFNENTEIIFIAPAINLSTIILPRISNHCKTLIQTRESPVLCDVSKNNKKLIDSDWIKAYETCNPQKSLSKIKQPCTIIQATDDFIDSVNINVILHNIPHAQLIKIPTNHWFDSSKKSFLELAKHILL